MTALFGYGTFCNTAWRAAILGAAYNAEPATLHGWQRVVTPSGYFSIAVAPEAIVRGELIALDDVGWEIADAWEEVPRYRRVPVNVTATNGIVSASTYVATSAAPAPVLDDDRFAAVDDAAVEAAIARFAVEMRALRARPR